MSEEDKQILLYDLCERLPYKTFVRTSHFGTEALEVLTGRLVESYMKETSSEDSQYVLKIQPYLRPMSSMTEEEDEWLNDRINFSRDDEVDKVRQKWGIVMQEIYTNSSKYVFSNFTEILDWLNENHFDYRDLIGKGLALEALDWMYV